MMFVAGFLVLILVVRKELVVGEEDDNVVMLTRPMQLGRKKVWGQIISGKISWSEAMKNKEQYNNKTMKFKDMPKSADLKIPVKMNLNKDLLIQIKSNKENIELTNQVMDSFADESVVNKLESRATETAEDKAVYDYADEDYDVLSSSTK